MNRSAVFHIEGGIGKHIAATAVVECYKKQNLDSDVNIVCAWPEVFLGNPSANRVHRIGSCPYFYEDYIYNKDVEIFAQEPYKQTSHITKKKHLIETWCDMIDVPYNGENPSIYFNFRERETGSKLIVKQNKPLLIFQPFGGPGKDHQQHPYSWTRDIHPTVAQKLVDTLSSKYDVVHVCYDFHPHLNNCTRFDQIVSKKNLFYMLQLADARLLVDSSLQHAAAAMDLPSTVVWVATSPTTFGYSIHNNIIPSVTYPEGTIDSYLFDYNFTGAIHECPYSSFEEIFNIEEIIRSLDLQ